MDGDTGLGELFVAALISGSVVAVLVSFVLKLLFDRRFTQQTEEIKGELERQALVYRSNRVWKERSLEELLGPVSMQLDRSNRAFARWREQNLFLEAKVVKEANTSVRDLLLAKGHLIPAELVDSAGRLIEHYDRWLEEYEKKREGDHPDLETRFVFAGPHGYPFPRDAERAFRDTFDRLRAELYEASAPARDGA